MRWLREWSVRHAQALQRLYRTGARWAPALAPMARRVGGRRAAAAVLPFERAGKAAFFDCRMCGQCVLGETGMACPMNCAKRMRNGPCGGVRGDGGCEVHPDMRCVWLQAADGRRSQGRASAAPMLPPLDARRQGQSTWLRVIHGDRGFEDDGVLPSTGRTTSGDALPSAQAAPAAAPSLSRLQAALADQRFAVTVEIAPPDSADPAALLARAERFRGLADAINITDGAGGNCHMSSVAAAAVLRAAGLEAVCQVGCRDRNRIALQGDVLGAAALGVRNVLCLTGDDVSQGDHPQARAVFDLDAVNLLHTLRTMRDAGQFASGRPLEQPPAFFLGATANPFVPPYAGRVDNLERKIDAGAQFVQTQFCFDLDRLRAFMDVVCARGLHHRAAILVGVGTLSSARALRWMAEHVPGVVVPDAVIRRMAEAADPRAEGQCQCVEMIHALQRVPGVRGVHLMGHRNEPTLARIIVASGLRPDVRASAIPVPFPSA